MFDRKVMMSIEGSWIDGRRVGVEQQLAAIEREEGGEESQR